MRAIPFFAFVAVLALVFLAPSDGRCQTFITFASDVTWETFAMNPDGSQGPSLGAPQFPSWAYHSATLYEIPGAAWMWLPGVNESSLSDLQGVYFSKQFDLQAPIGGLIFIAADDFAEVIVNGVVAGSTGSVTDIALAKFAPLSLKIIDFAPYLVPGTNTLTVRAQNGPSGFRGCDPSCTYDPTSNPAGVVFGGILTEAAPTAARGSAWGSVKVRYR